jgi:hypothetical protein
MTTDPQPTFGDLDGEVIEAVQIKLAGTVPFGGQVAAGTRVLLVAEAVVTDRVVVDRDEAGRLRRTITARVHFAATPGDELAEQAEVFLALLSDDDQMTIDVFLDEGDDDGDE